MHWAFWRSPKLPRPPDPLSETSRYDVYNISEDEAKPATVILTTETKEGVSESPIVYLAKTKTETVEYYKVVFKNERIRYSVYRTVDKSEALDMYNRLKTLLINLSPYGPKGSKLAEFAAFLQEIVSHSKKHPEYKEVHMAAIMGLHQPFRNKVPLYIEKINERIEPSKATPLILAVLSEKEEIVITLLALKVDLTLLDSSNSSALHYAASSSNPHIFKSVVDHYYKQFNFEYFRKRNNNGLTPFHLSCYAEKKDNVLLFLEMSLPMDILNVSRPSNLFHKSNDGVTSNEDANELTTDPKELKRQQDTRVTFSKQMIEDLEWSETKLGGNPLHWVTRRRTLDVLLQFQFPKTSLNFNQESVIHVMVRRKRLRCLIILLSNGFPPSLTARRRLTPLHYAILDEAGGSDVTLVQLLAVFDADLNASARGQTPRHVTQNIKDINERNIVLYILHSLGAKRCERKLLKTEERNACYDGCEPGASNNGKAHTNWPPLDGQTLYTKYLIEDLVNKKREDKAKGRSRVNLLCCDGGGTRGILAAQMLIELQKYLKKPIHEYFHWLSGTSTGSFISAYLALKRSPEEIRKHYVTLKDNIFAGERPYSTTTIEKFLKSVIPEQLHMSDIKDKKIVITAVQADCSPVQLFLFRNYRSPDDIAISKETLTIPFHKEAQDPRNTPIWWACRASGAAPSYFRPAGTLIDGGLIANNPTLDAMTEFFMYNKALHSVGRHAETQTLYSVVSIGTGRWPIVHQETLNVGRMKISAPRQSYNQAIALMTTLSIVASMTDNYIVDRAQAWCCTLEIPYFRLSPPISEQLPLDVKNDSELVNALYETKAYCHFLQKDFKQLAAILEESLIPTKKIEVKSPPRQTKKARSPSSLKT